MKTKYCIACNKLAVMWTGHIHTEIGNITSGWCDIHFKGSRNRYNNCKSTNPSSCSGFYNLSEIETVEDINQDTLKEQINKQTFSDMIDEMCTRNYNTQTSTTKTSKKWYQIFK